MFIYSNIYNYFFYFAAWLKDGIRIHQQWLDRGILRGGYGTHVVERVRKLLNLYVPVENKHVLVIGSSIPWIEVILLSQNVGHITTLEYNRYVCDHPKISVMSPVKFRDLFLINKAPMFDAMVTFSSIEHSGLGR